MCVCLGGGGGGDRLFKQKIKKKDQEIGKLFSMVTGIIGLFFSNFRFE